MTSSHADLLREVREQIGWRGTGPNDTNQFYCEHCHATHLDCTLIKHETDCLVTRIDEALTDEQRGTP